MTGIGPVEPGESTYPVPDHEGLYRSRRSTPWGTRAELPPHRRALAAALLLLATAVGSGRLHATRPHPDPSPWPAQTVSVTYAGPVTDADGADGDRADDDGADGALRFSVRIEAAAGTPVTVESIRQPSAALRLSASPNPPFTVKAGSSRRVEIVIKVGDCGKAPRNAGLPFLDVTLRNVRAKQDQSFILGDRYTGDLARAVSDHCERAPRMS